VTVGHVSGKGSFPPFETAGMGKKTNKKKNPKMKVGHFGIFFQRGSDLKIFLAIGSKKKKSCITRRKFGAMASRDFKKMIKEGREIER